MPDQEYKTAKASFTPLESPVPLHSKHLTGFTKRPTASLLNNLFLLRDFLNRLDINLFKFFSSVSLSLAATYFNLTMIRFIMPLTHGIISRDFKFVKTMGICSVIVRRFPNIFTTENSLFMLLVFITYLTAILKNTAIYASTLSIQRIGIQISFRIRKLIFNRYLKFGKLYFDMTSMARLSQILATFSNEISAQIVSLHKTLSQLLMLFIYIAIMLKISWRLTVLVLLVLPLLNITLRKTLNYIASKSIEAAKMQIKINEIMSNLLSCILLVKSYAREEAESKRFATMSDEEIKISFGQAKIARFKEPIEDIAVMTTLVLVASAIGFVTKNDASFKVANLFVFFYLVRLSIPAFNSINSYRINAAKAVGPISEVADILDDEGKVFVPSGEKEFGGLKNAIEFRRLNFSYIDEVSVLNEVTFSIEKGKMTAIVGPTGAGKTTLVNLIMRFYDCPPSSILIDGVDIREFTIKSLMRHIALVSQDVMLFNDTIKNNIIYGLDEAPEEKLIEVTKKASLHGFILRLPKRFDTMVGERGVRLSRGERQRLAIARALMKGAEILILDEATSSLDTKTEQLIQCAIDEAIKDRTTIVIAHRLSTIKHADKIVVLEKGCVVEEGSLPELLAKKGKFYGYWETQKFY